MSFISALYIVLAILGTLLLAFVGAQADTDNALKRLEARKLRLARKVSFFISELILLATALLVFLGIIAPSPGLLIACGNIVTGMLILSVNAASLNSRQPPQDQTGFRVSPIPVYVVNIWNPIRQFISIFKRH